MSKVSLPYQQLSSSPNMRLFSLVRASQRLWKLSTAPHSTNKTLLCLPVNLNSVIGNSLRCGLAPMARLSDLRQHRSSVAASVNWMSQLPIFRLHYRGTPHSSTHSCPLEALTGRKINIGLSGPPVPPSPDLTQPHDWLCQQRKDGSKLHTWAWNVTRNHLKSNQTFRSLWNRGNSTNYLPHILHFPTLWSWRKALWSLPSVVTTQSLPATLPISNYLWCSTPGVRLRGR